MRLAIVALVSAASCSQGYRAGSFQEMRTRFDGERRRIGCLDLAVASRAVPEAEGPVVEYTFGNGCDAPVSVDLASVRAVARLVDGRTVALALYDPRGEVTPARLEARSVGRESLEYRAPAAPRVAMERVCLDVSGVDAEASPGSGEEVCLGASLRAEPRPPRAEGRAGGKATRELGSAGRPGIPRPSEEADQR